MRDETRKRLERVLLIQRLKWGALAVAAAALILGALYWEGRDVAVVATNPVEGTVVHIGQPAGKFKAGLVQTTLQVDVKLDDARVVHLLAPRSKVPEVGEHVRIADHVHGSGRHTFAWR